jgi:predicted Zn-dependent peptidase
MPWASYRVGSASVTAEDLRQAALLYLSEDRYVLGILVPETEKPEP